MDPKHNMIIVNERICTEAVVSCTYDENAEQWKVKYENNETDYTVNKGNLEWLKEPEIWNPDTWHMDGCEKAREALHNIQAIYVFRGKRGRRYYYFLPREKDDSLFAYLQAERKEDRESYIAKYKAIESMEKEREFPDPIQPSERLMYVLLKDIINESGYKKIDLKFRYPLKKLKGEIQASLLNEKAKSYALHEKTHVDFMVLQNDCPILAVEVDGKRFHRKGTLQALRDKNKDKILGCLGIGIIRCRTDGNGEREKLRKALEDTIRF